MKVLNSRHLVKGQVWISAVLYLLIVVVAIVIVLEAGVPLVNKMRDKTTYIKTEDTMAGIDRQIADVASQGKGSQRVIPLEIDKGNLVVGDDKLRWEMETKAKILEPRTSINKGNLVISSNVDVNAYEAENYFILENSRILVNISKIGNITNWTNINTSNIINFIKFKENDAVLNGIFSFMISNDNSSKTGNGYTLLESLNLGEATVLAHVNSTNYEYDLELTLTSEADFIKSELKNLIVK